MKDPRQMTLTELKTWLRDRLQMRGAAGADVNLRRDEAPYELPVKLWKSGNDEFRTTFARAIMELVEEVGAMQWEPKHFHDLGLLLEAANLWEVIGPLETIAQSRRLLQHERGSQLHMIALRTLLALRWKGTLDFWLEQNELVGARWPGIIFEGLAQQDVDLAFEHLPDLATNREAIREVLNLFPGLMRDLRLGISTLRDKCRHVLTALHPDAAEGMRDWFRLRNYPLEQPGREVNVTLVVALHSFLGNESKARVLSPTLCRRYNGDCIPA